MTRPADQELGPTHATDALFHGLFLRVPLPILLCDRNGRVATVNDAYVAMFSRAPIDGLDLLSDALSVMRGLDEIVRRCLDGEASMCPERRYEADEVRGPRESIEVLVEALPLFDATQTVTHAALLFHDRTRGMRAPGALDRQVTRILPRLSHDLRGPLNAILGFAEILHERQVDPDSPTHQEFLGDIIASGRRMLELVNELDTFVRTQSELVSDEAP